MEPCRSKGFCEDVVLRGLEVSFADEVCARVTERVLILEHTATREKKSM
jgi:hypothetical protein